jgi:photosystem II stability/assembly factor-like uncharacterized protein
MLRSAVQNSQIEGKNYMKNLFECAIVMLLLMGTVIAQQKHPSKLFKLGGDEVQYSVDAGGNWEQLKLPFDKTLTAFSWDAKKPDRLLAGTQGVVYRSADAGKTWNPVLTRSPQFTPQIFSVSQKNPHRMYCAGTTERNSQTITEVYQSMDGGVNWLRVIVAREPIDMLKIDPDSPGQKITFSGSQIKGGQ